MRNSNRNRAPRFGNLLVTTPNRRANHRFINAGIADLRIRRHDDFFARHGHQHGMSLHRFGKIGHGFHTGQ